VDIDVGTDGEGLPAGKGSAANGAELYKAKCSMCHGPKGEGMGNVYPALIGPSPAGGFEAFARDPGLPRTVGNYWSHATTLYDYVRRAMPLTAPGSLTNDEVYALAAYLLAENEVIPRDATLDSTSLMAVKMPARDRFVPDDRRGGPALK
jgi:cytochrome c